MRQLVLDIRPDAPPTLENFVVGGNAELVATLAAIDALPAQLYLWGARGSGRSHLLRATVTAARERGRAGIYVPASEAGGHLDETPDAVLAVDDVDALDAPAQIALFNAFNRARTSGQRLVLAGDAPPLRLAVREDLRTRVGQCLVYEVRPLDDDARAAILRALAERRGLRFGDDVADFLLRHGRRDLPSLLAVLDALDAASLERKRPVTLPLLREMMQTGLEI